MVMNMDCSVPLSISLSKILILIGVFFRVVTLSFTAIGNVNESQATLTNIDAVSDNKSEFVMR